MQGIANVRNRHPVERRNEATQTKQTSAQESVCNPSALFKMDNRCCNGVRKKNSVARHQLLSASLDYKTSQKLADGTYTVRPGKPIKIYEPKERIVTNMLFEDRVVLASYSVNYFYPKVVPNLIKANFACIKGRGTEKARNYFRDMLASASDDDIVINADFSDYFGSIQHAKIVNELSPFMDDEWAIGFFSMAVGSNGKDIGLGLGSELNQLSAVSFPNRIDHILSGKYKYARYMDDIKVICKKSEEKDVMSILESESERLGLKLSPRKTFSQPITRPVGFLGFTFKRNKTGKVTLRRKRENVKNEKRKLHRMKNANVPIENVLEHYRCVRANMKKGCRSGVVKLDRFFNKLFKEEIMQLKKKDIEVEMALKEAQVVSSMVKEKTEEDMKINFLIREKYSMSQELALHRKKLLGTATDDEWAEYNAYVEECIVKAREEQQ